MPRIYRERHAADFPTNDSSRKNAFGVMAGT